MRDSSRGRRLAWCLVLLEALTSGQDLAPALPSWLAQYPGSPADSRSASRTMTESAYLAPASEDQVVGHYRKLFQAANLSFVPNGNGMGTAVRSEVPECNLLIVFRPLNGGTEVRVSCAARLPAAAGAPVVISPRVGPNSFDTSPYDRMAEQIRKGQEETRRMQAEAEARHKAGIQEMTLYDQPYYPPKKKKTEPAPPPKTK